MTFENINEAAKAQRLDRETWAERQKVDFEFTAYGTGEVLLEPYFFGRAFDRPPAFNFSAVGGGGTEFPEVKAIVHPRPTQTSAFHNLNWQGWWEDPQFEMQMHWGDPVIPALNEGFRGSTHIKWQKIHWDVTGRDPDDDFGNFDVASELLPVYSNQWVQSSHGANRWAIVQQHGVQREPRPGKFSAKFTFDASGESRWLIPLVQQGGWFPWGSVEPNYSDELYERNISSTVVDNNYISSAGQVGSTPANCGWIQVGVNPPNNKYTVELDVFSTAAAQVTVLFQLYDFNAGVNVKNVATGLDVFVGSRIHEEVPVEIVLLPGWNTVRAEYKVPSWLMPNVPAQYMPGLEGIEKYTFAGIWPWLKPKIKANGDPGESVFIARALMWPDWASKAPTPWLTVGVAEWIKDAQGMFVGATLWVRTAEPSPLCDGAFADKLCAPLTRVTSLPTLSQQVAKLGLGPGNELVATTWGYVTGDDGLTHRNAGLAFSDEVIFSSWITGAGEPVLHQEGGSTTPYVDTSSPPSGQQYSVSWDPGVGLRHLSISAALRCDAGRAYDNVYYFSTVSAGETWTLSLKAKVSTTSGTPVVYALVQFYGVNWGLSVQQQTTGSLSTSYQTITASATAVVDGFVHARIVPAYLSSGTNAKFTVGDVSFGLT